MQETTEEKFIQTKDIFTVADELGSFLNTRTDKPSMPTGINSLDKIIWGLHKSELLVMASRPSQGKTSMTVDIAWRLAKQGFKVVYISLEMSASSVLERILCNEYTIDGWRLRTGLREDVEKAKLSLDKLRGRLLMSPLTIIDNYGFKVYELEEVVKSTKPDVVFIDHLQRVSMAGIKNRQEGLAEYVQSCKRLALQYKFACVLASQINRQGSREENAMDFMKGCVSPDSIVNGKTIKDRVENGDYSEIKTTNTASGESFMSRPSRLINSGLKQCLKVKTKSGREIILSKETMLFDGSTWKKSETFSVGEKILVEVAV